MECGLVLTLANQGLSIHNVTADCTTVVILLGNRRWPCGLGMNRQFT